MVITSEYLTPATFSLLLTVSTGAALLTGSTLQWATEQGLFAKRCCDKSNQYNVIVAVAAISALTHTINCFTLNLLAPQNDTLALGLWANLVWMIMTQSSILLVSRKLSLTAHRNSEQAWRRLLWINYALLPFQIFIGVSWTVAHVFPDDQVMAQIVTVVEPVQIAMLGLIEFLLSGAFLLQMWKYQWTPVERRAICVLLVIAACDIATILLNRFLGDLESTCVKGFVYALRIRLEVSVLGALVDYIQSRRRGGGAVSMGNPQNNTTTTTSGTARRFLRDQFGNVLSVWSTSAPSSRPPTPTPSSCQNHEDPTAAAADDNGTTPVKGAWTTPNDGNDNDVEANQLTDLETGELERPSVESGLAAQRHSRSNEHEESTATFAT